MACFGALLALSAPGYGFWPLAWLALMPALWWVRGQTRQRDVFWGGAGFGAVYQGLYCLWFWDIHPLTWLGFSELQSILVTLAGWLVLVVEGAALCGLLFWIFRRLTMGDSPIPALVLFPAAWVVGFDLLTLSPMALSWARLEYTQADLPAILVLAGWIGGIGVSYLLVFHNVFWDAWVAGALAPGDQASINRHRFPALLFPLIAPGILLMSHLLPQRDSLIPFPAEVAVIQGNLPIETIRSGKLGNDVIEPAYLEPLRRSRLAPETLVVLPEEGVISGWVTLEKPLSHPVVGELQRIAETKNIAIAVGASTKTDEHRHNSILMIQPEHPVEAYHKRILVPFGESTPYGADVWLSDMLAGWGIAYATPFQAGHDGRLFDVNGLPVGGLVCFELADPGFLGNSLARQASRDGAELLINTSNLGWFHENHLLESQFLAIARMRAAETRTPLVVASNTGISAIIGVNGTVIDRTWPNRPRQTSKATEVIRHPEFPPNVAGDPAPTLP